MLVKMFWLFIFVIILVHWAEPHLVFPINYCNVAMACIHDSRPVCATSPDGCSRRSFLDQCDMFEYNCDFGAQYTTTVTTPCAHDYEMVDCVVPNVCCETTEANCKEKIPEMAVPPIEFIEREATTTPGSVLTSSVELLNIFTTVIKPGEVKCSPHCDRPRSWATTVKGETRDFFRVLQGS